MSQSLPAAGAAVARAASRQTTGIVIPVYLPPGGDNSAGVVLLADNLAACVAAVDDPKTICLAVDGDGCGAQEARRMAQTHGVGLVVGPQNRGKLHALRLGGAQLAADDNLHWFATIDADGNVVITGRVKHVINRGGIKINPTDVENLIDAHPSVGQSAIVPMPDPVLGEKGCVFVTLVEGASMTLDDVLGYLKERGVAKFKWPERLEIVPFHSIIAIDTRLFCPVTSTEQGKKSRPT